MAVNCNKCKFFYITWQSKLPRGCSAYEIKTARIPSLVVQEVSGSECTLYTPKDRIRRSSDSDQLDLRDKNNW